MAYGLTVVTCKSLLVRAFPKRAWNHQTASASLSLNQRGEGFQLKATSVSLAVEWLAVLREIDGDPPGQQATDSNFKHQEDLDTGEAK